MAAFVCGCGVGGRGTRESVRCRRRVMWMAAEGGDKKAVIGAEGDKKGDKKAEKKAAASVSGDDFEVKRKSAEELMAEGIEDDVKSGIRFEDITSDIVDDADPFKEDEVRQKKKEDEEVQEEGIAVDITGDGKVTKQILIPGEGPKIPLRSNVKVHYVGTLSENGKKFDSSYDRKQPFEFELGAGKVIKGWDAVLPTMRVGEKAVILVQPSYAYGRRGVPPVIPSNATLQFEIEVVEAAIESEPKTFAEDEPETARSPDEIAIAYMEKLKKKDAEGDGKKGFFDRFYFISPFASQTGERPPWWLNPNITFFIVFVTVGAAFWVVFQSGGVHQGYVSDPIDVNPFTK